MARRAEPGAASTGYFLRFAGTAFLLISGTLVLVLVVLPQRYVLSAGFQESGLSFPNPVTPFDPSAVVQVAARPLPPPRPPGEIPRGPAEIFWQQVLPLLETGRYAEALPLFERYLADYPGDLDVRREYGLTLVAAGRADAAVPVFTSLLVVDDSPDLHHLLARTLRDLGRTDEASSHYRVLSDASPGDEALTLEWVQALAAAERYGEAEAVLLTALGRDLLSVPLRAELARVYYYSDRTVAADVILTTMSDVELAGADALTLRDDVRAALTLPDEPPVDPLPPPTLLEQAAAAREEGDFDAAARLFAEALAEDADDIAVWQAYADFLQYELADFEGARKALLEVERLSGGGDSDLQYRIAQIEIWTDRTDEARARLEALLTQMDREEAEGAPPATDPDGDAPAPVTRADVHALLGDLHRWDGQRLQAVRRYELALETDPDHPRALEGLAILRADVDQLMIESEGPRLGAIASTLSDTDDFDRLDFGGEWIGLSEDWVWGTRTGTRWLQGVDLNDALATHQGLFVDLEGARWSRWGTIRTALHVGAQNVRSDETDLSFGASARYLGAAGGRTDLRFDHEPAYLLTNTLQSALARVDQDRIKLSHSRPLNDLWILSVSAEAASLDPLDVAGADRNLRLLTALSAGRAMSRTFTLGLAARAVAFSDAAPPSPLAGTTRLYWDPASAISVGPYAQLTKPLGTYWEAHARASGGVAMLDERGPDGGTSTVPHVSGEAGLAREGARYRTAIDFFYYQGQFDGYRAYGLNLSFSSRGWFGRGGS